MGQHISNVGPTLHCQRLTIYQRCDSMPTLGQRCHAIWDNDASLKDIVLHYPVNTILFHHCCALKRNISPKELG